MIKYYSSDTNEVSKKEYYSDENKAARRKIYIREYMRNRRAAEYENRVQYLAQKCEN